MNPNYPTLTPPTANPIWFDVDAPYDEETEVNLLDAEFQDFMCAASQIAAHIQPLGKSNGLENPEAPDLSDEDDANDDSDDTESHDEEDEEEIVGNHTMETI